MKYIHRDLTKLTHLEDLFSKVGGEVGITCGDEEWFVIERRFPCGASMVKFTSSFRKGESIVIRREDAHPPLYTICFEDEKLATQGEYFKIHVVSSEPIYANILYTTFPHPYLKH